MRLAALWLGLWFSVLFATPAWAEPSETDRATARELALAGHNALQSRDWATAAEHFARADGLVHAPTLVVDWARALQGLGRFVEAHEKYELVLREGVDKNAPKSWQHAFEEAKRELELLKPRLGWVKVILKEPTQAEVTIDGARVPPAALGVKRAADPGFPEIKVSAPGYEPLTQTLTVGPGEEKSLEVRLRKLPESETPQTAATPRSDGSLPSTPTSKLRRPFTIAAFALGGAGAITGSVAGILAIKKHASLKQECDGTMCQPRSTELVHKYHTVTTLSNVGFAVGAAGLGAGLVLLLTEPKSRETFEPSAGLHVRPLLGELIGAQGTF
jgi:hypothetical protein